MTAIVYEPVTTLSGHRDTVTALEFSPDGRFLVSGGQDGVLLIFSTTDWRLVHKFVDASPVLALLWHPILEGHLFCGFKSGDVHALRLNQATVSSCRMCSNNTHPSVRWAWRCGQTQTMILFVAWHIIPSGIFWLLDVGELFSSHITIYMARALLLGQLGLTRGFYPPPQSDLDSRKRSPCHALCSFFATKICS